MSIGRTPCFTFQQSRKPDLLWNRSRKLASSADKGRVRCCESYGRAHIASVALSLLRSALIAWLSRNCFIFHGLLRIVSDCSIPYLRRDLAIAHFGSEIYDENAKGAGPKSATHPCGCLTRTGSPRKAASARYRADIHS